MPIGQLKSNRTGKVIGYRVTGGGKPERRFKKKAGEKSLLGAFRRAQNACLRRSVSKTHMKAGLSRKTISRGVNAGQRAYFVNKRSFRYIAGDNESRQAAYRQAARTSRLNYGREHRLCAARPRGTAATRLSVRVQRGETTYIDKGRVDRNGIANVRVKGAKRAWYYIPGQPGIRARYEVGNKASRDRAYARVLGRELKVDRSGRTKSAMIRANAKTQQLVQEAAARRARAPRKPRVIPVPPGMYTKPEQEANAAYKRAMAAVNRAEYRPGPVIWVPPRRAPEQIIRPSPADELLLASRAQRVPGLRRGGGGTIAPIELIDIPTLGDYSSTWVPPGHPPRPQPLII